jgi:hypothetical protein
MTAESPFNPNEDLAERRSDQGVWNGTMGEAAAEGAYPVDEDAAPVSRGTSTRSNASRRGGRSFPEITGQDVSRNIANQFAQEHPLDPNERKATYARGGALAHKAIADMLITRVEEHAKERTLERFDPDYIARDKAAEERDINAHLAAFFDKKNAPKQDH